jgi:sulfur transfer complex TusBCD TusB component (DsrH family)
MARKFLTPINLNQLELQNAVIQNLGSNPETGVEGQLYYNSNANELRVYDGANWLPVGSTEAIGDALDNIIVDGTGISTSYDDGAGTLTITNTGVTSLTGTASEVTVSASAGSITIGLPDTIVANLTGNAASATFATTAGTANAVAANSVALGTDTTGNYVATITGTANEVEVSGSGSESANITIGLPDNVTIPGSLIVSGNLTVSGSTTYLNTETLTVEDNIVLLNSGVTGVPSTNAGLEIERGDSPNTSLIWNESTDSWSATNDGTNYHALARKYVENVGNSASTVFALTHNLGTRDVTVQVFDNSTYETVEVDIARTSTTVTTVTFAVAPSSNAYRVVITG